MLFGGQSPWEAPLCCSLSPGWNRIGEKRGGGGEEGEGEKGAKNRQSFI